VYHLVMNQFVLTVIQKLEVRKRKRDNLPDDLAHWKDAKYDAFFTDALMSDDEDGAGAQIGKFVSRAPLYRSTEVRISVG
jgi:hypothetical protein